MARIRAKNPEKEIKKIIFNFLNPLEYRVFIFGSRATGKSKKFSDYDIGILGEKPIPWKTLALIEEVFENSDLPFDVDIVDFSLVSQGFRKIALSKIKRL